MALIVAAVRQSASTAVLHMVVVQGAKQHLAFLLGRRWCFHVRTQTGSISAWCELVVQVAKGPAADCQLDCGWRLIACK
jgi:hypothetical protein